MQYLLMKSKIFWILVFSLFWFNFGILSANADELYGDCNLDKKYLKKALS